MSCITHSAVRDRFFCDLPSNFNISSARHYSCTIKATTDKSNDDQESNSNQNNKFKLIKWLIPKSTKLIDVFVAEIQQKGPIFRDNIKLCCRFSSKGYCFASCKNKEIH